MMKNQIPFLILMLVWSLAGCAPGRASLPAEASPAVETGPTPTATLHPTVTAAPQEAVNVNDPPLDASINPLTGLAVENAQLLERRPVVVKVQNVPRESRPQWGLSKADLVYEYYIEYGDTRFAAVYYGQDSELVGPIRSARHVDIHLVDMYKGLFVFGGAYDALFERLLAADFAERLIREGPNTAPALRRYDPNGKNYLMVDTAQLVDVVELYQMDNHRPDLSGMAFDAAPLAGGEAAAQVFVRFSGGMYNHWDYDAGSVGYLRFSDVANDLTRTNPVYEQLVDRLTGEPIAVDNLVIVLAEYETLVEESETAAGVYDIHLLGEGDAFLARDGMMYPVRWKRSDSRDVLALVDQDGQPVPMKPGQTWFELMGKASQSASQEGVWQFDFLMP